MNRQCLKVIYIRPSTYDDDGYVVRFWRGVLPSNTLACLKALTETLGEQHVLGPETEVSVEVYDDTVQRIPIQKFARMNRQPGMRVVVGFVGVQSNQFERMSDLALELRDAGLQVMVGGFHVSGVLALFDDPTPELQRLLDAGVTLVRGEAEAPGALASILRDAWAGAMQPIYNILDFPDLEHAAVPRVLENLQTKFLMRHMATIDTSRGCPFNCSFCTIINVQGRKMRHRSAQCVLNAIEENYTQRGITVYFFTDDNFSRNPVWEEILDGLIALRRRGIEISFMMQTDTQAHRIPRFVDKASAAGCYLAFIGMESVNPKNLAAVGKTQNNAEKYAEMVEKWHAGNILVHVGYIIGLPDDTRESVCLDMEALRNQVKVDFASLFMLVPLPGSRDHWKLVQDCTPIDADLNNYDGLHETFRHGKMSPGDWRRAYDESMQSMYNTEHIVNVLLRCRPQQRNHLFWVFVWYRYCALEGLHPMATGLLRLKDRTSRRRAFPRENLARYALRRFKDFCHGAKRYGGMFFDFQEVWMLTRDTDDPRWAALADLRLKWAEVKQHVAECDLRGRYEDAAGELKFMLTSAAGQMRQLSGAPGRVNRAVRRRLRRRAGEIDNYIRAFELQLPGWHTVVEAEKYIGERIVAGYEEAAIRYVARRRRFNAYRRELCQRVKTGRVLNLDLCKMAYAAVCEIFLACRFTVGVLMHR